jgi:hypothetical protein
MRAGLTHSPRQADLHFAGKCFECALSSLQSAG